MFELMHQGGPAMWLILLFSVIGAAVFLERLFNLHRAQIKTDDFLRGLYNILRQGNTIEAVAICDETPGPVSRVVRAAILHMDEGRDRIERAIEEAGLQEIPRLERNLNLLATIGQLTPLMGLLGTVLGMMRVLSWYQAHAPLMHGGDWAGGLWVALTATASSLFVSILAYAGYNFLVARVQALVHDMDQAASEIDAFLLQRRWERG